MKTPAVSVNTSPYVEQEIKARTEKVRSSIATRLKKACSYLPDAEFLLLVDKIAGLQLAAERRVR